MMKDLPERKSLEKLEHPYLMALEEFERELNSNSDRGIVLICASIIDQILEEMLKGFLIDNPKVDKDLFKGNGPLQGFDQKIKMAFYLGLISKNEFNNIIYLQRVRNKFAHQVNGISFENEAIKNVCQNFNIPKNCYAPPFIPIKEGEDLPRVELNPIKKDTTSKDRYIYTFKYLYTSLLHKSNIRKADIRQEDLLDITADMVTEVPLSLCKNLLSEYENNINKLEQSIKKLKEQKNKSDNQDIPQKIEEANLLLESVKRSKENFLMELKPIVQQCEYGIKVVKKSMIE